MTKEMRLIFSVKIEVSDLHMVRPSCLEDVVKFKNIRFIFGGRPPKGLTGGAEGDPSFLGILSLLMGQNGENENFGTSIRFPSTREHSLHQF